MEYDVEIIRNNIKNMHLYVLSPSGKIRVTAPVFVSDKQIKDFVENNSEWIEKRRLEISESSAPKEYISGEKIMLWGKKYTLEVIPAFKNAAIPDGDRILLYVKDGANTEQKEKIIKDFYRKQLRERLDVLVPEWEEITNLKCSSYQIRDMKTRWGTCNTKTKKLWFALRLAEFDGRCAEYVVLHELVHTLIPNHGADFKNTLTKYMPHWKEIKRILR